jgi:asparagine synthase (glutamine-hydrolysing)
MHERFHRRPHDGAALPSSPRLLTDDSFAAWIDLSDPSGPSLALLTARGGSAPQSIEGTGLALAWRGMDVSVASSQDALCVAVGRPRFDDSDCMATCRSKGAAAAWLQLLERDDERSWAAVHEDFAVVLWDRRRRRGLAAVDRFARRPLCYSFDGTVLALASRADEVPGERAEVDKQALFNYAYHHVIPAPRTIFRGVSRLDAAHRLVATPERLVVERYWQPHFAPDRVAFPERRAEFISALEAAVSQQLDAGATGCYLSGGTDSSTVAGMATRLLGAPVKTFSIGFDAAGYDEMSYARIAAAHFATDHHEHYVTPDDLLDSIPSIASHYDQPFGNSSVVPALLCARMAMQAGVARLLAGDGGDELFGGNSRYREEQLFAAYGAIPRALRTGLIEPACLALRNASLSQLRKLARFAEVMRMPPPERNQRFNLLDHIGAARVLSSSLLAAVDPGEPLAAQNDAYAATPRDAAALNRMLAFEWKYILADNDLPKVAESARLAGVRAAFPLLDERLVDVSLRLPPWLKVRGTRLRYFFKEALRDFLPPEIITKKKHGFALPFGVWLLSDRRLKAFAMSSLEGLRDRGVIEPGVLDVVAEPRSAPHAAYYGELVWIMMMLELWLQAHASSFRVT